jgi:hypothetical protein
LFTPTADYDGLRIGDYAFAGCSSLTSIALAGQDANFISVGNGAFRECTGLKSAGLFKIENGSISAA